MKIIEIFNEKDYRFCNISEKNYNNLPDKRDWKVITNKNLLIENLTGIIINQKKEIEELKQKGNYNIFLLNQIRKILKRNLFVKRKIKKLIRW